MRSKLSGFVVSVLMVMAVGGLTAPSSFATDYFVKNLNEQAGSTICKPPPTSGPRIGYVVFMRTDKSMFATVNLRNVSPGSFTAELWHRALGGTSCSFISKDFTVGSSRNGTVSLGPLPRKGNAAFWVEIQDGSNWFTGEVPSFGF